MKKEIISLQAPANAVGAFAPVVKAGPLAFISAQAGVVPGTGQIAQGYGDLPDDIAEQLSSGRLAADSWAAPIRAQCWQMFENHRVLLEAVGASLNDILRINMWVRDFSLLPVLMPVRSRTFAPLDPPPITNIGTTNLCLPAALIQAQAVAVIPSEGLSRSPIDSNAVSQFVGHYMLGARAGEYGFAAGMIAARNDTGLVVRGYGDIPEIDDRPPSNSGTASRMEEKTAAQVAFILRDLERVLSDNGCSLRNVVKTTIYLKDMRDFGVWERLYNARFAPPRPPLTAIGCRQLGMPDFNLEIEVDVHLGSAPQLRELTPTIGTDTATVARAGDLVHVGGQFGIDLASGKLVSGYKDLPRREEFASGSLATDLREGPAAAQLAQALSNVATALEQSGTSLEQLLQLNVYVTDAADIPAVERVVRKLLGDAPPAGSIVEVPGLPLRDAVLEIDGVALISS